MFRSGIFQAKQINDHCQKHVFPSQSQLAQQNIKLGHFYINPNWMFDEARNTAIILPENIGENVLPYLFIQGAPMLQVNEYRNFISIVLTQKVLLGDPRFQPFWTNLICIAGNPGDPLSKGALYIIPPEEAKKAELTEGITLSPYEGKTHGTLFFKIDSRFDLTKIPPTADQARFAALLGLGMTFDVVHFPQEHLMPAYDGLLLYTRQGKNLKLYSPIASKLKEKLKLIDYDRKLMIPSIFTEHIADGMSSDNATESQKRFNEICDWYYDFFLALEGKPLSQMMVELCELNPEILAWRHREEVLEMMRRLSPRSQQRLVEFSHFIFWPQNEESVFSFAKEALKCNIGDITKLMDTGSIGAHIINKAIDQETGIGGLRWVQDNLYHFSLLYQFVEPNYVKNDYAAILWGFLTQLPKAAWSQPASNTFHETIDYFLSVLQKRTPNLKAVHMKWLGLNANGVVAKYMLSYLQNAQPRIQEISELYDKRNEPVQFKTLLRNKLFGRISKAADREKLMTALKLNWPNKIEDQTENLLEIVKINQL